MAKINEYKTDELLERVRASPIHDAVDMYFGKKPHVGRDKTSEECIHIKGDVRIKLETGEETQRVVELNYYKKYDKVVEIGEDDPC